MSHAVYKCQTTIKFDVKVKQGELPDRKQIQKEVMCQLMASLFCRTPDDKWYVELTEVDTQLDT